MQCTSVWSHVSEVKLFQQACGCYLSSVFMRVEISEASDGGLILVRELDKRRGLEKLIDKHLSDSRQGASRRKTKPQAGGLVQDNISAANSFSGLGLAPRPRVSCSWLF